MEKCSSQELKHDFELSSAFRLLHQLLNSKAGMSSSQFLFSVKQACTKIEEEFRQILTNKYDGLVKKYLKKLKSAFLIASNEFLSIFVSIYKELSESVKDPENFELCKQLLNEALEIMLTRNFFNLNYSEFNLKLAEMLASVDFDKAEAHAMISANFCQECILEKKAEKNEYAFCLYKCYVFMSKLSRMKSENELSDSWLSRAKKILEANPEMPKDLMSTLSLFGSGEYSEPSLNSTQSIKSCHKISLSKKYLSKPSSSSKFAHSRMKSLDSFNSFPEPLKTISKVRSEEGCKSIESAKSLSSSLSSTIKPTTKKQRILPKKKLALLDNFAIDLPRETIITSDKYQRVDSTSIRAKQSIARDESMQEESSIVYLKNPNLKPRRIISDVGVFRLKPSIVLRSKFNKIEEKTRIVRIETCFLEFELFSITFAVIPGKVLKITAKNLKKTYQLDFSLDKIADVNEIIDSRILPLLQLSDNKLILLKPSEAVEDFVISGTLAICDSVLTARIYLTRPRLDLVYKLAIQTKEVAFKLSGISFYEEYKVSPKKISAFCLFCIKIKGFDIQADFPINQVPDLIYCKLRAFDGIAYYMKIESIQCTESMKYLISLKEKESSFVSYGTLDTHFLMKANISNLDSEVNIEKLCILISVDKHGLQFNLPAIDSSANANEKSISSVNPHKRALSLTLTKAIIAIQKKFRGYKVRKGLEPTSIHLIKPINGIEYDLYFLYHPATKSLAIILKTIDSQYNLCLPHPIPIPIPYLSSILKYLTTSHSKPALINPSTNELSYFTSGPCPHPAIIALQRIISVDTRTLILNRIIYRAAVKRNGIMHQIYVKFSKTTDNEDVMNFNIVNTVENKTYIVSIDVKTVVEKIGFGLEYASGLCYYIIQHLLVIKLPNVYYIKFSDEKPNIWNRMTHIQAICRGFLCRKKFNIVRGKLIVKMKKYLNGKSWTLLCYDRDKILKVFVVNASQVSYLCLDRQLIEAIYDPRPLAYSLKTFVLPSLKIIESPLQITGLDMFLLHTLPYTNSSKN